MANPFDNTVEDSYNPFAAGSTYDEPAPVAAPTPEPAYSAPSQSTYTQDTYTAPEPDNNYGSSQKSGGGGGGGASSTVKSLFGAITGNKSDYVDPVSGIPISEADLDAREAALNKREAEIQSKESALANGTIVRTENPKNFPPKLNWWRYRPDEDLPESARKLCKFIFYIYLATGIVYLVNVIGCLCCLNSGAAKVTSSPATKIVLSVIYLVIFWPLSFEISYFVLYNSLAGGKAVKFFCFMLTYFIWFGMLVVCAVGLDDGGSVGFIQMINLFSAESGKFVAVIALIFCILACLDAAAMAYTFILLIRYYKKEGLQKKAFSEASTYAAQKAKENPDLIMDVTRENPDLVYGAATTAAKYA
ncbi:hypothetical protein TRFO_34155 [Tritrichomonas foetus]|uniref:Secretory carrier membrane protein n=1 Tax=Tritrichomonas foetus TaxID=1144522 RepID=A0A1J4JJP1_9EUKA|nr:hypothetical protein TRFO_34155 [Tritrichomonas foetus]|eukprot:OHS99386.1 hypothetical protein TRFO_34155 [Tritrichomonas foetus]